MSGWSMISLCSSSTGWTSLCSCSHVFAVLDTIVDMPVASNNWCFGLTEQKTVVSAVAVLWPGERCPCCAGRRLDLLLEACSHNTVQTVQKTGKIPQVLFLDKVVCARCCTTTGAWVTTVQKTVEFPQLQCCQGGRCPCFCSSSTVVDVPVLTQRRRGSCWRCLRLSSSPELVDIPVTETVGFVGGLVAMRGGHFSRSFRSSEVERRSSSHRWWAQLVSVTAAWLGEVDIHALKTHSETTTTIIQSGEAPF